MRIIQASNVDLIEPFPLAEVQRLVGWLHCYKSAMLADGQPSSNEDMEKYILASMPNSLSFGVIDKNNTLNYKHEAPLIGVIWADPGFTQQSVYFHFTSTRRAWGSGLMDEAGHQVIKHLFETYPLSRISAFILNNNKPAKNYLKRLGFKQDGLFPDYVTQNNIPRSMAHFGLTKRAYLCPTLSPVAALSNQTTSTKEPALEQTQPTTPILG